MGGTAEYFRPLHRSMQGIFHVENEPCNDTTNVDIVSMLTNRHICSWNYRARAHDRDGAKRNRGGTAIIIIIYRRTI